MEKKKYVKPEMLSYEIETAVPLAASGGGGNYANPDDDPGELYEQIEFGEGYCKNPD